MYKITLEVVNQKKGKNGHIYYSPLIEYKEEYYLRYNLGRAFEIILNYITRRENNNENK